MKIVASIGPNFYNEIVAASLAGKQFSWSESGVEIGDGLSPSDLSALQAVIDAPDPSKPDVKKEIASIELAQPVTQRELREMILAMGQAFPAAQASQFYQKAKAQDDQIAALRSEI
jgi:flagellar hook-length control protein FliK